MKESNHKRVTEKTEVELYEKYGLSLAEIHSKKYYVCENCNALLVRSGNRYIAYRRP